MKMKTRIKAGLGGTNHSETLVRVETQASREFPKGLREPYPGTETRQGLTPSRREWVISHTPRRDPSP